MLRFLKFSLILSLLIPLQSVGNEGEEEWYSVVKKVWSLESSLIPTYIQFGEEKLPKLEDLNTLFDNYWKTPESFGFIKVGEEKDQLGFRHFRYKQTFNTIPIEFAEIIVHSKDGYIYSINGKLIDQEPNFSSEVLSESQALEVALRFIGASQYKWEVESEELHLRELKKNLNATYFPEGNLRYISNSTSLTASDLKKAYQFKIYAQQPLSNTEIYIDVQNGDVLFTNNLIHTSNVKGTATTAYSGKQTINTDSVNSTQYRLRQTVSGNGINTYDLNNGFFYGNAVDFTDTDNDWNNTTNQDHYATDAHWGAEQTYAYFDSSFKRNSIDDRGFELNSYIHYSVNFANAFWDGLRMTYGDGAGSTTPLVSVDIAGHEISHGLTSFSADLIYAGQSGALNESFSDIFGTAIEFFSKSSNANWTIGEDIGNIIRSLSNPGLYGDPDTRGGTNWVVTDGCLPTQQNDQCGVHINSGVQNFWFYLLSEGGTGTNDKGDSYSVTGITIDSAAAIAYRNLTVYLTRSSNYDDARFYSIQAAIDLYGACSQEVESTMDAWHAVGVGEAYKPGILSDFISADNTSCKSPHTVSFKNLSNNAVNYRWDFGDGDTSNLREPIHTYNEFGSYDVELIIDGGACGRDTLKQTDYIDIDTLNRCVVNLIAGNNTTEVTCSGKLFDTGGGGDNYLNNQTSILTIEPADAASITLNFKSFDIESGSGGNCNSDYLDIFDGPSINSPLIGSYCNTSGSPGIVQSTFGSVTIRFVSNSSLNRAGFEMDWDCSYPVTTPSVKFEVSDDTTCTGEISFSDMSSERPISWTWDFGDGTISNSQNPIHTYLSNGDFDVKLIASNNFGEDSVMKNAIVHVNRPLGPSITNDTVCLSKAATLKATGSGELRWYTTELGGNHFFSGTNYTINSVDRDTSVWVEDYISAVDEKVGPVDNNFGVSRVFLDDDYLEFDVSEAIILKSVLVYPNSRGTRVIELRDNKGNVLQSKSEFIRTSASTRITLDFKIEPGTDYRLGLSSSGIIDMYGNNRGVGFPYKIEDKVSITGSSDGARFYYYFYDWTVKSLDCTSPRKKVSAFLDPPCSAISLEEQIGSGGSISVYPNPARNKVLIKLKNTNEPVQFTVNNLQGKIIYEEKVVKSDIEINSSNWSNGLYFLQVKGQNINFTKKIIINH